MIYAVLIGVLCALVAAGLVRPFLVARRVAAAQPTLSAGASRSLLRQLRDLDDDLAAGRIAGEEHRRLRSGLEVQAVASFAATLPTLPRRRAILAARRRRVRCGTDARPAATGRRGRRVVVAGVAVLSAAAVMVVLVRAIDHRDPVPVSAGTDSASSLEPPKVDVPSRTVGGRATKAALADVEQAVAQVKSHPGQAAAHVELARGLHGCRPATARRRWSISPPPGSTPETSKPTPPSPWSPSRRATPVWPTPSSPRGSGRIPTTPRRCTRVD